MTFSLSSLSNSNPNSHFLPQQLLTPYVNSLIHTYPVLHGQVYTLTAAPPLYPSSLQITSHITVNGAITYVVRPSVRPLATFFHSGASGVVLHVHVSI